MPSGREITGLFTLRRNMIRANYTGNLCAIFLGQLSIEGDPSIVCVFEAGALDGVAHNLDFNIGQSLDILAVHGVRHEEGFEQSGENDAMVPNTDTEMMSIMLMTIARTRFFIRLTSS